MCREDVDAEGKPTNLQTDVAPTAHSLRKTALENRKIRSLQRPGPPASSPLRTQHEHHLAAQTVVDVEGLLAVVIFLPVPSVGANN